MIAMTVKAKHLNADHLGKTLTLEDDKGRAVRGTIENIEHIGPVAANALPRTQVTVEVFRTDITVTYRGDEELSFDD